MIRTKPKSYIAPYQPIDWQFPALRDKSSIMLLTGSAGGGKSRCAAEKLNACMWKYPGATGIMLRKAREWAMKSIVPFMWHTVMGRDKRIRLLKSESQFVYPNGSILAWGGMKDDDQRESIRSIGQSGAIDFVWMEEATAFTRQDFDELRGRMRGNAAGWRQVMLSTNPDAPLHWINQDLIIDQMASVYYSNATNNPHNPSDYIDTLNSLSGVLYQRLVLGLWVLAEGAIYDNFSTELNVDDAAEYNPDWEVKWGIDDGYAYGRGPGTESHHPRVVLFGQVTPQGGLHIFDEYYATEEIGETTIVNVMRRGYPKPEMAYVDSSAAELKGRIWGYGIQTIGATHLVTEGIKNVRRLICDAQGVRLLKIHPRCRNLISELQSYRYSDSSSVARVGEQKPLKVDDHGPDALRYLSWQLRYS